MSLQQLSERIQRAFPAGFVKAVEWRGDLAITVTRDSSARGRAISARRPGHGFRLHRACQFGGLAGR